MRMRMMQRGRKKNAMATCCRKYDLPLFCAAWATRPHLSAQEEEDGKDRDQHHEMKNMDEDKAEEEEKEEGLHKLSVECDGAGYVLLGGGGGMGNTGIRNSLVLARYDRATDMLSEAVHVLSTDDDAPYRMAVHPTGHGIVCSFSRSCRIFELVKDNASGLESLKLEPSTKPLLQLEDVGQQRCLVFSADGTRFATGGDDGRLRVFEWPSLQLILDQADSHKSIKDLDFSLDASFVASTGGIGPCRIWDLSTSAPVVSLSLDQAGDLGFCRYSRDGTKPLLFLTVKEGEKGCIATWNTNTWKKVGMKKFQDSPISAFAMSSDGKFLAMGSSEGDISIIEVGKMAIHQRVKRAHMIFVTSMEFSRDGRALLSVSGDSSARVTAIYEEGQREGRITMLIFILIAILLTLYVAKSILWNVSEPEAGLEYGLQVNITD